MTVAGRASSQMKMEILKIAMSIHFPEEPVPHLLPFLGCILRNNGRQDRQLQLQPETRFGEILTVPTCLRVLNPLFRSFPLYV
jgi:hypothetical protein